MSGLQITAADDRFHERSDDLQWIESVWFNINVPHEQINGLMYLLHRPNQNHTTGGLMLVDPSGERPRDCLVWDYGAPWPVPDGAEVMDIALPNGLSVTTVEPLRAYDLAYRTDVVQLVARWEAVIEPLGTTLRGGGEAWVAGHFEQLGRLRGTLQIGDRTLEVDTMSMRDRSWGPRRPGPSPRAEYPWAANERNAFMCFAPAAASGADDPIEGQEDRIAHGWHLLDGTSAALTDGTVSVLDRRADGHVTRVLVEGTDELGRSLHAEGILACAMDCNVLYPWVDFWWSGFSWELNGRPAWGENLEFMPLDQARRFLRRTAPSNDLT